ncbi:hypothetical protein J5N97_028433 [Dioscorea zingiberensis]|uniref:Uncharacterized protein n=1 Tax=Dioscorea zingiberensis TaxID=325984 RepID=A0A9D5BZ41_9LILI|nr:hypothetical protein J5N97_028433 [Dioscorea zingiberensis]
MAMDSRRFLGLKAFRSLDWADSGGILPFDVALLSELEKISRNKQCSCGS